MSATVAAALKKIAVAIMTDKKALKTVGGIILGILIIICLPVVSIVSILNGDIQFDEARLHQIVVQNLCHHYCSFWSLLKAQKHSDGGIELCPPLFSHLLLA